VTVEDGVVSLVDDDYEFRHEGGIDDGGGDAEGDGGGDDAEGDGGDGDDGPSSTSHLSF
jgi:hypothetical protein